jgi:hypothetical protein
MLKGCLLTQGVPTEYFAIEEANKYEVPIEISGTIFQINNVANEFVKSFALCEVYKR